MGTPLPRPPAQHRWGFSWPSHRSLRQRRPPGSGTSSLLPGMATLTASSTSVPAAAEAAAWARAWCSQEDARWWATPGAGLHHKDPALQHLETSMVAEVRKRLDVARRPSPCARPAQRLMYLLPPRQSDTRRLSPGHDNPASRRRPIHKAAHGSGWPATCPTPERRSGLSWIIHGPMAHDVTHGGRLPTRSAALTILAR